MGINPHYDVGVSISKELQRGFKRNDFEGFREMLSKGGPMVIIGDNSGEIYFDYMLMANLRSFVEEIFYVVKVGRYSMMLQWKMWKAQGYPTWQR